MLQLLEWEPSGSFYQPGAKSGSGSNRTSIAQDMIDHTLPPNPRKVVLYRPSVTHLIAVRSQLMLAHIFSLVLAEPPL